MSLPACGEPQELVRARAERSCLFPGLEVVRMLSEESTPLTLIGAVGESGFDRVVAVGEYLLLLESNMAEVAFTVAKDFQGKALGRLFLRKLAAAAREHGISGLVAFAAPHNRAMIDLFKTLPYRVKTTFEDDVLRLSCKFEVLKDDLT